jgi:hypothetical protein
MCASNCCVNVPLDYTRHVGTLLHLVSMFVPRVTSLPNLKQCPLAGHARELRDVLLLFSPK